MKDLGFTPPKPETSKGVQPVTIVNGDDADPKPQYPSLRLNGEQADKAGLSECRYGEEYELTIRVKATSIGGYSWDRKDEDRPAVEFDVIACDEPKMVEGGEEEKPEEEDKTPKRKPKQREVGPDDSFKKEYKGGYDE